MSGKRSSSSRPKSQKPANRPAIKKRGSVRSGKIQKDGLRIWVLSDGTAGMRFQAVALAEAIAKARPGTSITDYIAAPHRLLRSLPTWGRLPRLLSGLLPLFADTDNANANASAKSSAGESSEKLSGEANHQVIHGPPPRLDRVDAYPDILVTCGRRMAGISIALRTRARRVGAEMKTVHLQDPRLNPEFFDALIVPAHDPTRADNVLVTLGSLNRLDAAKITAAAESLDGNWLKDGIYAPVAVMLGGNNARYRITRKMVAHMADELGKFARATTINDKPIRLLLVPSRRTPPELIDQLSLSLGPVAYEVATPEMGNPYPGVLAAKAVIITADSVNMVSEAAITGKPVLVAGWRADDATSCGGETGRIGAFHRAMIAGGHSAVLGPYAELGGYEPLDERHQVVARLLRLLGR